MSMPHPQRFAFENILIYFLPTVGGHALIQIRDCSLITGWEWRGGGGGAATKLEGEGV